MYLDGGWDSQGWSSSMTSSMQLAQECLKDPPEASEEPPAQLEGLEMFAQTIETGELKQSDCVNIQTAKFSSAKIKEDVALFILVLRKLFLFVLAVLRRIKVTFIDTIIRIEHQPLDLQTDVALEVHITR